MEYRRLGRSGLKVSPLCLGVMMFGDRTDEAEAGRIVAAARDAGVNFIDTADAYARGESERVTGRLIAADRTRWVLATKVSNPMSDDINDRGASRRWLMAAADASLRRLDTDHIDLWYLHRDDVDTPLEETVGALGDLIRAGKILHIGLSNFRAWRIAAFAATCDRLGVPRPIACQPCYNAMDRTPEIELLPCCEAFGLGVVPYSPLARGVLTAKYAEGAAPPADTRAGRNDRRMMQTEFRPESLALAKRVAQRAGARGMSAGQLALNWVLNSAAVTSVIAGPRTLEQWTDYLGALGKDFTAEDEAFFDSLVPAGHPSTAGYSDPQYPVAGRRPRVG